MIPIFCLSLRSLRNIRKDAVLPVLFCVASCATKQLPLIPQAATLQTAAQRQGMEATGNEFAVAAQGPLTSQAALEMIKAGGNIIDAFAAASFVVSVERPHSTGIGGGGFLLYFDSKTQKTFAFDFREMAPLKGHARMFLDKSGQVIKDASTLGVLSSGVPGLVRGVLEIHALYGKLPRSKVMAPAIKAAREGFPVYPELQKAMQDKAADLNRDPEARRIFLKPDGTPFALGDNIKQIDLSKTLELISDKGPSVFYEGSVARALILSHKKRGGLITEADLRNYKMKQREPVSGTFRGHQIVSFPPPSSGGVHLIQILNMIESEDLASQGSAKTDTIHVQASAFQQAFFDRAQYMADTDFVSVPVKGLISKEYAQASRKHFDMSRARAFQDVKAPNPSSPNSNESPETTHFSMIDSQGNVVASTQTINGWFGGAYVIPGTGILMNNEMDDFSTKPGAANIYGAVGSEKNLVEGGKRPLSSMTPTIAIRDGRAVLALGSPSGTRIITCVASSLVNRLEHKLSLFDSIHTLRYHQQWQPDVLRVEEPGFPSALNQKLSAKGWKIEIKDLGCKVQAVESASESSGLTLRAVSDLRGLGSARAL